MITPVDFVNSLFITIMLLKIQQKCHPLPLPCHLHLQMGWMGSVDQLIPDVEETHGKVKQHVVRDLIVLKRAIT
jgi:hypothetical protein